MTKEERLYHLEAVNSLYPFLKSAFQWRNEWLCFNCGVKENLRIHHKRYGEDITINDMQVLCKDCHNDKTEIANELRLSGGYCPHCQRAY